MKVYSLSRKLLVESHCCREQLIQQSIRELSSVSYHGDMLQPWIPIFLKRMLFEVYTWQATLLSSVTKHVTSKKPRFCIWKCVQIFRIWLASLIIGFCGSFVAAQLPFGCKHCAQQGSSSHLETHFVHWSGLGHTAPTNCPTQSLF